MNHPHTLRTIIAIMAALAPVALHAAHSGPVPAPTDPFGAPGLHSIETRTFPSPGYAGQVVTVYAPVGAVGARPTWFFCHGYGGTRVEFYGELLRHLASHGWTTVFSPYPPTGGITASYPILFSGFEEAAARYPDAIDTSKVGFAGHSFGGGAAPSLLLQAYRELGWGAQARCVFAMAPWYSGNLTNADLLNYPAGTQVIMQVYEDDVLNDHRMAIDIFRRLGLPDADKDYLLVRSDEIAGYAYDAAHNVPARGGLDALLERGVMRIAAALSASCFAGSAEGRAVALGGGSALQCDMGADATGRALRPMFASDEPWPLFPQSRYAFPFAGVGNPRILAPPPEAPAAPAHLVNLSARARSDSGDRLLVAGAAVQGVRPKSLLVRAAGPALTDFGVVGAMPDPRLAGYRGTVFDIGNDTWSDGFNGEDALSAATVETGAFGFAAGSKDAALLASFASGTLTVHAVPASGGPGVVLVEIYDADLDASAQLVNLSARAYVGTGDDVLVAGFVIRGSGTVRLLIRAVGPTLDAFDVSEVLPDPQLTVQPKVGSSIAANNDWQAQTDAGLVSAAAAAVGAFALPDGSKDACVLVTLPAGIYTAHASDTAARSGNVLVEVYAVP